MKTRGLAILWLGIGLLSACVDSGGLGAGDADDAGDAETSSSLAAAALLAAPPALAQAAYLKASNSDATDFFGHSIALSADGSTLAVGAHAEASAATGINGDQSDDSAPYAGAVYVFVRRGQGWIQQAYLKASNAEANDTFGLDLSLSADGSTLAVGAFAEGSAATGVNGDQSDNSAPYSGAVYVFKRQGVRWSQQAYLKASNTGIGDWFGWSVSLSATGSTLAVGAQGEASAATGINGNQADDSAGFSGAVYLFERLGATWKQEAYVKASNTGANDAFGFSVALSGDGSTLAVGAYAEDSAATGIGGPQADESLAGAGAVYVFARRGASWVQQAYVKASNPDETDAFGSSVALSALGSTLAVGAVGEATSEGAVYVFARGGSQWSQQAYVKASNPETDDQLGISLALSADGSTLAVGAIGEASAATGIGGNQADDSAELAGATYLFRRSGPSWSQRSYVKASNTDRYDTFGQSVALSADGATLAVGASGEASAATGVGGDQHDDSAESAGAVYVFGPRTVH